MNAIKTVTEQLARALRAVGLHSHAEACETAADLSVAEVATDAAADEAWRCMYRPWLGRAAAYTAAHTAAYTASAAIRAARRNPAGAICLAKAVETHVMACERSER